MHRQCGHPKSLRIISAPNFGCGNFSGKCELVLDKIRFFLYNQPCSEEHGPVVQSVSTPACHAGGRRFESVRGRQIKSAILLDSGFYFCSRRTRKMKCTTPGEWCLFPARREQHNNFPFPHGKENVNESVRGRIRNLSDRHLSDGGFSQLFTLYLRLFPRGIL